MNTSFAPLEKPAEPEHWVRSRQPAGDYPKGVARRVHDHPMLSQAAGNLATQRLLRTGVLQPKLSVTPPGDVYEQEADRIADQVMATPAHPGVHGAPPRIQRFSGQSSEQVDAAPASVDQALASSGRPLEPALRQDMEQRFGRDLSRVRVHTDTKAAESAEAVNSLAYTVGQHVVFSEGRYAPQSGSGRRLLAHELTHTIQQSFVSAAVLRHQPISIEPPGTSLEQVAEERSTRLTPRSGVLAPVHRVALQRQPAPPPKTEKAEESGGEALSTIFVADESKRRDKRYARRQAQADAARIRKSGTLSFEDRQLVRAKLRFFEGEAWEVYSQEIKPALVEVTREEIEMPGAYGDMLEAIVTIMECAPVSSRESPIDKNPIPESSPCGPAYHTKRNVTKKEYVDLLWEWFRIANTWSQVTTSYRSPDPAFVVPGSAGRKQISGAVAKTAAIVDAVSAAGGEQLVARYKGMVATFTGRAEYKESHEAQTKVSKVSEEVHNMDRYEIARQWESRKDAFLAVASAPNRLSAHQLFQIWLLYWTKELDAAWEEEERVRSKVWEADPVLYADNMFNFKLGKRDALGPEYQKAADRYDTANFMLSRFEKVLNWLEDMVDTAGKRLTFQDINEKAFEMAQAEAQWGWIRVMALAVATIPPRATPPAAARPAPKQLQPGPLPGSGLKVGDIIHTPLGNQRIVAVMPNGDLVLEPIIPMPAPGRALPEAVRPTGPTGSPGIKPFDPRASLGGQAPAAAAGPGARGKGPPPIPVGGFRVRGLKAGYKIQICNDSTVIEGPTSYSKIGIQTREAGGALTDPATKTIWVNESVVIANGIVRKWGARLNFKQVTAHEMGHAEMDGGTCAMASRKGADMPWLTTAERMGLLDDAVHIRRDAGLGLDGLDLPPGYRPPPPTPKAP